MLGGKRGVAGPAVFLAVRAVGGEVIEVRAVGGVAHRVQRIRDVARAAKAAARFARRGAGQEDEQVGRGLGLVDPHHKAVAEAVVGERRLEGLVGAPADVNVALREAVGVEVDVGIVEVAVRQQLAELQHDPLPRAAAEPQAHDPRVVFAEIV